MRRLTALCLFTIGYLLTASLDPAVAAAPALALFAIGSRSLVFGE